jgi:pimeloyl-ACP methyl ester carboxylesterase
MDTIDVNDLRIAYERAGTGPAVVLLHGYVGDGATTWRSHRRAVGRVHGGGLGCTGRGWLIRPARAVRHGAVRRLPGRVCHPSRSSEARCRRGVLRWRPAIDFCRRHPALVRALVLVSAYAGWGGSLPAEVAAQRLEQALRLAGPDPGRVSGHPVADHVHRCDAGECCGSVRRQRARLPPGRLPGHRQGVRRGPA